MVDFAPPSLAGGNPPLPLFHFFSDRHPRVIRIIKYVLFLLLYGYGLFIFWGYGLAGLGV